MLRSLGVGSLGRSPMSRRTARREACRTRMLDKKAARGRLRSPPPIIRIPAAAVMRKAYEKTKIFMLCSGRSMARRKTLHHPEYSSKTALNKVTPQASHVLAGDDVSATL